MSRYNLVDEAWIPVRFISGERGELGIRATLLQAKDIAVIEDSSPLVVAALHRFLLALLYRALKGPTDSDQAKALFKSGFPVNAVDNYLDEWRERFWLYHEIYPFYQVPDYEPKLKNGVPQWRTWPVLAAERNADNAKVLFDHTGVECPGPIPSSKAARWLLACQTFALGGGNSDFKYTRSGPSATSVMVIPLGASLHDTLLFSLVPENREVLKNDLPVWERAPDLLEKLKTGPQRSICGWVDLYTWRTRSIKFQLEGDGESMERLAFASGVAPSGEHMDDPMLSYRVDSKQGRLPLQFRERGLWRDFDSLMPGSGSDAPKVIENAIDLTRRSQDRFPRSVLTLGLANNKAKIEFWRMERFALPQALQGERSIRSHIRGLLDEAEDTQTTLWRASRRYARFMLGRGDKEPHKDDISRFLAQMNLSDQYWSDLESFFHVMLREYTLDKHYEDVRLLWLAHIRKTLASVWTRYGDSLSLSDAWELRAFFKAGSVIGNELKRLDAEIEALKPKKERP